MKQFSDDELDNVPVQKQYSNLIKQHLNGTICLNFDAKLPKKKTTLPTCSNYFSNAFISGTRHLEGIINLHTGFACLIIQITIRHQMLIANLNSARVWFRPAGKKRENFLWRIWISLNFLLRWILRPRCKIQNEFMLFQHIPCPFFQLCQENCYPTPLNYGKLMVLLVVVNF